MRESVAPVTDISELLGASDGLQFPILVKPDLGDSGAGTQSFASLEELETAGRSGALNVWSPTTRLSTGCSLR